MSKAHLGSISFSIQTTTAQISVLQAEVIQNMLKAGGITLNIQELDFPTILTHLAQHNFQAAFVGWSGRPDPDQNSYNHFVTGGPNNYGQYSSATVDKYLKLGRQQTSSKERKADYIKVAQQLAKDAPYIFLDHPNNAFGMKAKLKGFVYVPDGIIRAVGMTK
jgi:peptide/nickel transport system substrate-binding protein